jgi:hypothetical protein
MSDKNNSGLLGFFDDSSFILVFLVLVLIIISDQSIFSRQMDGISNGIGTVRNLTDALTNTVQALKQAVEAPLALKRR